jgi:anhydro-N-acetylmuramic acid kinase
MDGWYERHHGAAFDPDGAWAASGKVDAVLLERLRADPYFALPAPKSTGRDLFTLGWLDARLCTLRHMPAPVDVQTSLAELTASTVADACHAFDAQEVRVCGGGARNGFLMSRLAALLAPVDVTSTVALGVDPGAVEALAFAWLARERLAGRPGNLPAVTGARGPRVLGAVYSAPQRR